MPTLSTPAFLIFSGRAAAIASFFFTSTASELAFAPPEAAGSLLLTQPERESAVAIVRTGKRYRVRMVSLAVQGFIGLPRRCGRTLGACWIRVNHFVSPDAVDSRISPE